jgi:hypothetical protein
MVFGTHNGTDCRELYRDMGIDLDALDRECHNSFAHKLEERDQTLKLASGFEYRMVLPNVRDPTSVRLGRLAMAGMSMYVDLLNDYVTFALAYRIAGEETNLFENANAKIFDMSWIGVLVVFVSILWVFAVYPAPYDRVLVTSRTYFCMQSFFWVFILFYMPHYADGTRFMVRAMRSELGRWVAYTQVVVLIFSWLLCACTIPNGYVYAKWFRPAFETLVAFSMWASVAFSHDENGTFVFALVIETVASFACMTRAFHTAIRDKWSLCAYHTFYWAWHTLLALTFTLEPLLRHYFREYYFRVSILGLYPLTIISFAISLATYLQKLKFTTPNS